MVDTDEKPKFGLHAVFVQANTIAGYRYLDLSGIVLNRIGDHYEEFTIDPGGCVLRKAKNPRDPYAIRFAVDKIWLQYSPIESLTHVVDTAHEWIEAIAKDIEVTRFNRLAVRSQFFAPCKDVIRASAELSKRVSSNVFQEMIAEVEDPDDVGAQYMIRVPIKQFVAIIQATVVKKPKDYHEPTDFRSDGLVFDIDIYRRRKLPEGLPRSETRSFLQSASDQTSELLERVGRTLLEVE